MGSSGQLPQDKNGKRLFTAYLLLRSATARPTTLLSKRVPMARLDKDDANNSTGAALALGTRHYG